MKINLDGTFLLSRLEVNPKKDRNPKGEDDEDGEEDEEDEVEDQDVVLCHTEGLAVSHGGDRRKRNTQTKNKNKEFKKIRKEEQMR